MEECGKTQASVENNDGVRRFNNHSVVCMELISKMEKQFFQRWVSQTEKSNKYIHLFRDAKDSYKVMALIVEELQADLSLADLQFVCYPYRKILAFYTSLSNSLLQAFAEVYEQLRQIRIKESLEYHQQLNQSAEKREIRCVQTEEAEEVRRRKEEFAKREKINYIIQAGIDDQDGEYMAQLNKILENKEVSKRYKIPTTAIEMQQVKEKMDDIMRFADYISDENARFKTQEFINLDHYKQSRQSIDKLTTNIYGQFESSFRSKFVATVKQSSRILADEILKANKKALVSQECQTYQFAGSKKPQMESLIKEVEAKVKLIAGLTSEVQSCRKFLQQAEQQKNELKESKKNQEDLARHFSHQFQTIEKEYAAYRLESELAISQMRGLMYKKDMRLQEIKDTLQKMEKIKSPPPPSRRDGECQTYLETADFGVETERQNERQNQYSMLAMKEKHESLDKLNVLKELKIKRLETYNTKLREQLRATFEQLSIDIDDDDLDRFIKKAQSIDKIEIRKRISILADSFRLAETAPIVNLARQASSRSQSKSASKITSRQDIGVAAGVQTDNLHAQKSYRGIKSQKHITTRRQLGQLDEKGVQSEDLETVSIGFNVRMRSQERCEHCLQMQLFNEVDHGKTWINVLERNVVNLKLCPVVRKSLLKKETSNASCQTTLGSLKDIQIAKAPVRTNSQQIQFKPRLETIPAQPRRQPNGKKNIYHHDGRIRRIESFEDLPQMPSNGVPRHRTGNAARPTRDPKEEFVGLGIADHVKTLPSHLEQLPNIHKILQETKLSKEEIEKITRHYLRLEKGSSRRVDMKLPSEKLAKQLVARHCSNISESGPLTELMGVLNRMI